jgi:hypothetical protein
MEKIYEVLRKLHRTIGFPRVEIEEMGKPSTEASFLNIFRQEKKTQVVAYILKAKYETKPDVTEYDLDYLLFSRSALETLVKRTLSSEQQSAEHFINGTHKIHKERWDDFAKTHSGGPAKFTDTSLKLSLMIKDNIPYFDISYTDTPSFKLNPDIRIADKYNKF